MSVGLKEYKAPTTEQIQASIAALSNTDFPLESEESKRLQNYSKSILSGALYELYRYCFDQIGKATFF